MAWIEPGLYTSSNNEYNYFPMEWLFSWEVCSVVLGFAITFVGLSDFKLARIFFLIAAADAGGGVFMWGLKSERPLWQVSILVFLAMGLIGTLAFSALRYVNGREGWIASRPSLDLAIITVIYRMKDSKGAYMKGGQNDLVGVLRVTQKSGSVRHVRSLQIAGDVPADFGLYMNAFSKGNGTESLDQIEAEYKAQEPFHSLSSISYPTSEVRIDPDDQEFVKFRITQSMGAISTLLVPGGSLKDYFGFASMKLRPKYLMTAPAWNMLVVFSRVNSDGLGIYPVLRDEVKSGQIKIQANLDGELFYIPAKNIRFPWAVSLDPDLFDRMIAQDLFNGIDNGERNTVVPNGEDPLAGHK